MKGKYTFGVYVDDERKFTITVKGDSISEASENAIENAWDVMTEEIYGNNLDGIVSVQFEGVEVE